MVQGVQDTFLVWEDLSLLPDLWPPVTKRLVKMYYMGHLKHFTVQLQFMHGTWSFGKFTLAEATTIYYGLSHFMGNAGNLER
jgi:hypothetical protein